MITMNRITGILLILISLFAWVTASGFPEGMTGPGPAFFPKAIAVLLTFLSLLLIIKNPTKEGGDKLSKQQAVRLAIGIVLVIIYAVLIPLVGFFVSTVAMVTVLMMLMRVNNWMMITVTAVSISIAVTLAFELLLNVPIPHGWLY